MLAGRRRNVCHVLLLLTPTPPRARDEVLAVRGELDPGTAAALRTAVLSSLDPAPERLVLDVSGMTTLGRPGIRTLVALRRRCASAGVRLVLRSPNAPVRQSLQIGHVSAFFEIES